MLMFLLAAPLLGGSLTYDLKAQPPEPPASPPAATLNVTTQPPGGYYVPAPDGRYQFIPLPAQPPNLTVPDPIAPGQPPRIQVLPFPAQPDPPMATFQHPLYTEEDRRLFVKRYPLLRPDDQFRFIPVEPAEPARPSVITTGEKEPASDKPGATD